MCQFDFKTGGTDCQAPGGQFVILGHNEDVLLTFTKLKLMQSNNSLGMNPPLFV